MSKDKEEIETKEKTENESKKIEGNTRYSFPLVYVIAGLILLIILSILIYCFIVSK